MKICSVCQQCYDDSIAKCDLEDHGTLTQARSGNCNLVEGYKIKTKIESGSPVELYRATHLASEKNVLIRFIAVEVSSAELLDDLRSVVNLSHPSLARVFEFGNLEDKDIFIVFEDTSGQNLQEYLSKHSTLTETQSIKITRQIAEGLEKLHEAGVVHQNISPANIFFTISDEEEIEAKITNYDFGGLIKQRIIKTANGIEAKPEIFQYYSPEQFTDREIDFKSDLYSLAIVFYEILLGHVPYKHATPQEIQEYIFNEDDVDGLDHDLRALIGYTLRESLQQRLSMRPRTTINFARQLRHLELVATPVEEIDEDEDVSIKSTNQSVADDPIDRDYVVDSFNKEEKYSSEAENAFIADAVNNEETELINKVSDDKAEEELLTNENFDEGTEHTRLINEGEDITDFESEYVDYIEKIASDEKQKENKSALKYIPVESDVPPPPPNSFVFKKSHVYVAGTMMALLFGSFFLVTFYNWQSNASLKKVNVTKTKENIKTPTAAKNLDVEDKKEPELTENIAETNGSESDDFPFEKVQSEVSQRSVNRQPKKDTRKSLSSKSKPTKSGRKVAKEKTLSKKQAEQKPVFEDKVIIIGGDKGKQNKNVAKKGKNKKVFSDVVIYY